MVQYEVTVTPSADGDLDEIFTYVAEKLKVPDTAAKLVERIYSGLKSLNTMPKRFPLSRDAFLAKQGFRLLPVDNYLAFYVVDEDTKHVIVHRVLYAKRQYIKLFCPDGDADNPKVQ